MNNFTFWNPTKLIFGKDTIAQLSSEIPGDARILVTFGGGSVKSNGVYNQVVDALSGKNYTEFWGIEPNPTVETIREAVKLAKEKDLNFILAVGGGSVIDGSKLIASAVKYEGDPWDIVKNRAPLAPVLPLATVLTLPATGSEMNRGSVISNKATKEKYAFYANYPVFSILDPQTTFSLPKYQIACGLADTFVHVMEQYLTTCGQSPLMDRWAEGILQTVVEIAPDILIDSSNYELMSSFMLSATMALNGFIAMGVSQDWATHMIGHEITALTGLTHGETLAIILPSTMRVRANEKGDKIVQFGQRVFGVSNGSKESMINETIDKTEAFFRSLGLKTRLSEHGIDEKTRNVIVERFKERGVKFGENLNVDYTVSQKVLEGCK